MRLLALLLAATVLLLAGAAPASAQEPVGCGGPQSVIRIEGLKGAIPYGDPEKFTLSWDNAPGSSASNAHIKITDTGSGEVFFSRRLEQDEEGPFFVRLDLGERAADVTVTSTETDASGASCEQSFTQRVIGLRRFELPTRCREGSYRPRKFLIACGDGGVFVDKIRWRVWNRPVATGTGTLHVNTCQPNCAEGRFRKARVRLRAYRLRRCEADNAYRYTRVRITLPKRPITERFDCPGASDTPTGTRARGRPAPSTQPKRLRPRPLGQPREEGAGSSGVAL